MTRHLHICGCKFLLPRCIFSPHDWVFLVTLVVFDGEIGIVQHLWDQSVVKVVPLDGVVLVHRTDGLDHLSSKERETDC